MWVYFNGFVYALSLLTLIILVFRRDKHILLKFALSLLFVFSLQFVLQPLMPGIAKRMIYLIIMSADIIFVFKLFRSIKKIFLNKFLADRLYVLKTALFWMVVIIGISEGAVAVLAESKIIKLYSPLVIMGRGNNEDWREAHITGEKSKVFDPVLFWKPADKYPYNKYGFKGDVFAKKKSGKKRIFFYGDSNTDGQDEVSYAKFVQSMKIDSFEIFNAGVAGWSSYQGLKRFLSEYDEWRPDVVFFSFGWNDCANAMGRQDKEYSPPPKVIINVQRFLLQYKTTLFFLNLIKKDKANSYEYLPRVSKEDYIENINTAYQFCRERGIQFIVLTRPYVYEAKFFETDSTFRRFVPLYNETLRILAEENNIPLIDVQMEFAGKDSFFSDESHFNRNGYKHLAEIITAYTGELTRESLKFKK
ncbi:TPA: hypothetical protein DCW38_00370 [candidate division WOR-3 bacterium]|uniref:SGNH hydrolase-type esterase domain-containing protein n=1 Tax=candidate division WOR-3 bacterium TaxID=2052148 RepID=A0A350H7W4_UNCW3|nr:hypothetical protein [candidate division WOR-3 bacterium]